MSMELLKKQCGRFEFNDYPKMFGMLSQMAQDEYEFTKMEQQRIDLELSDLLHYLENDKLPAHKIAKVSSEIRKRRIARRENNAHILYLDRFIRTLNGGKCKSAIQELKQESLCQYNDCEYKPRVLDIENDLFGGESNE